MFTGGVPPLQSCVHACWCEDGDRVCPSERHPGGPGVWHSRTHTVLGERWVPQVFQRPPSLGFFLYPPSCVFSQVRLICSPPATPAPRSPALTDQWTPSWTPPMISWRCSSKRSAACSPTPTFTWEVMRWTSRAGETLSDPILWLKNSTAVSNCFCPTGSPTQTFRSSWLNRASDRTTPNWSPSTSKGGFLVEARIFSQNKNYTIDLFIDSHSLLDIVTSTNKGYVVWQEVFDNAVKVRFLNMKRKKNGVQDNSCQVLRCIGICFYMINKGIVWTTDKYC